MAVTLVYVTGGPPNAAVFQGAGTIGLVPSPASETGRFLRDDGEWAFPAGGGGGSSIATPNTTTTKAIVVWGGEVGDSLEQAPTNTPTIDDDGNIVLAPGARIDTRDPSVDGAKLDGIETGATQDQDAEDVPFNTSGSTLTSTNVQEAIDELDAKVETLPGGGGGDGDITGPEGATSNAIPRYSGTSGKTVKDSNVTVDDTGNITLPGGATVDGRDLSVDGTKLDGIETGATADQSAAEVPFTPAGTITATSVQAALVELDGDIAQKTTGPASSTDNTLSRFDGTTGKLLQGSLVTVSDAGSIGLPGGQTVDGRDVSVDGTKLDTIETGATGDQTAAEVPVTPSGLITSTNVAAALTEIDNRAKLAVALGPFSDTVGGGTLTVTLGSAISQARFVLTADATVAFAAASGYTIRAGDTAVLEVNGDFALRWPSTVIGIVGRYDRTTSNLITVRAIDSYSTPGNREYVVTIQPKYGPPRTGLVFRQVMSNFFDSRIDAIEKNETSVTPGSENLFSILSQLEEFRNTQRGDFKFRLNWPTLSKSVTWRQVSSPLDTYKVVDGYEFVSSTGSPVLTGFGGLSLSAWSGLLLDGIPGVQWGITPYGTGVWAAVGRLTAGNSVGIPTTIPADVGFTTNIVELYVDA